jgi:oligopeptide/dipeptide ABC transporter ATP-binding protein
VQAQILNMMLDLQQANNLTYVFISHDLAVVRYMADRLGVMYLGKLVETGPAEVVLSKPVHPYTQALLNAVPVPDPRRRGDQSVALQGELPSPLNPPSGCRFRTRCPYATDRCAAEEPQRTALDDSHWVACHFPLN